MSKNRSKDCSFINTETPDFYLKSGGKALFCHSFSKSRYLSTIFHCGFNSLMTDLR